MTAGERQQEKADEAWAWYERRQYLKRFSDCITVDPAPQPQIPIYTPVILTREEWEELERSQSR